MITAREEEEEEEAEAEAEEAEECSSFPSARLTGILCGWTPAEGDSGSSRLIPAEEGEEVILTADGLGLMGVGMRLVSVAAEEVTEEVTEEAAEEEALSFSDDVQLLGYLTTSTTLILPGFDLGEASTTRGSIRIGNGCCCYQINPLINVLFILIQV